MSQPSPSPSGSSGSMYNNNNNNLSRRGSGSNSNSNNNRGTRNNNNNNNINHNTGGLMQPAPYPPMAYRNPSTAQLKSSFSTKPQYSSSSLTTMNVGGGNGGGGNGGGGGGLTDGSVASEPPDSKTSSLSCAAQFCHPTFIAAINPAKNHTNMTSTVVENLSLPLTGNRKLGPVLMEIQRLTWKPTSNSLYALETIARSRGNPSLGSSVASTCLDVLPPTTTIDNSITSIQPCVTGLSTGALCVHSFPDDFLDEMTDQTNNATTTEYYHTGRHHRPATAVAWRPLHQHVAVAWAAHHYGATAPTTSSKRGGVPVGSHGWSQSHDRDFGCFIWDLQSHNTKVPLRRLGHQVGAVDVGWIMQGHLLVLGSQLRNFQVFDLRSEQPASQPMSVYSHPSGVHVRPDPYKPYQFVTFSKSVAEPVKLWDARRVESCVGEIKYWNHHEKVSDVQWSPLQEGNLTLAVGDALYDYDTSLSRPMQTGMVSTDEIIANFCLYPYKATAKRENGDGDEAGTEIEAENAKVSKFSSTSIPPVSEMYHNRAIVCFNDGAVHDVAKHRLAPLGISTRDGRLAQTLGAVLRIGSTADGPAAMESLLIRPGEDVSATMMRRARCQHAARYSMDTNSNIKLLSEDGVVAPTDEEVSPTRESLLRLWIWVDRMESLFVDGDGSLPIQSLVEAGASFLLHHVPGEETLNFSDVLSCSVYTSPSRRAAWTSCGWAGKFDLSNVLAECESLGEYERSAALAVWHGELGAGVQALQRGAASLRSVKGSYAEMLELVALCVAGFRGGSDPSLIIWRQACSNLMERSELSGVNRSTSRVAYMRGLLKFLMNTNESGYQQVLDDENLSLCDRVAFACRFLPRESLQKFLDSCIEKCQQEGNIEGLTVTGIDRTGIKILQAFVDRYADVQTAALITSRVILPTTWEQEKWVCVEWLDSYRSLLNTWQMWQSRAMFDVDRSELMRTMQTRETSHQIGLNNRPQSTNRRFLMAVPFQMDARCTYCQQSLSLKQNNTNTNQWLREMNKSVLNCCPHCRSPLPRCAICMLSLGVLNPFLELQARAGRPTGRQSQDDLTTASNLPFAEWFSWCMRCKHGGHAHHMMGWFATHNECAVSNCNCQCQFDGIQKLQRPALTKSNTEYDQ